jgi:zinc transport system permease protein
MIAFLQMAFYASLLASIPSGLIGSYVVVKRIANMGGSISHSILAGMGLFLFLNRTFDLPWLLPLYGAFFSALIAAGLIGYVHLHHREREDAVISAVWSTGMAIGVIFVALTPGTNVELMNFLLGNILWVTPSDLLLLAILDLFLIGIVLYNYRAFLALCFDEEQAELQGINTRRLYILLLALVAISIVVLMQVIGSILVISLLAIPSMIASLFTQRLPTLMTLSSLTTISVSALGLATSYLFDWPPGATIGLLIAIAYFASLWARNKYLKLTRAAK